MVDNIIMTIDVLFSCEQLKNARTGVEFYAVNLLNSLAETNVVDLSLLCLDNKHITDCPSVKRVYECRSARFTRTIKYFLQYPSFLSNHQLLHFPNVSVPFFRIPYKVPVVVTYHDLIPFMKPAFHTFKMRAYFQLMARKLSRRSDAILAVSESTKNDVHRYLNVPKEKIFTSYLASRFDINNNSNLSEKSDYVLCVGTLEPRKNVIHALSAFLRLKRKSPGLVERLKIVGGIGWQSSELIREIRGSREYVDFLGYVSDVELEQLYKKARLLIYPSFYEGFGLPVLEAMACGCPVITSDISSLPEVGGDAVYYVNPHDEDDIFTKLKQILSSTQIQKQCIDRGLVRASQFSWDKCANQTLRAYDYALSNKLK